MMGSSVNPISVRRIRVATSTLGNETDEILAAAGYTVEAVGALRRDGVV